MFQYKLVLKLYDTLKKEPMTVVQLFEHFDRKVRPDAIDDALIEGRKKYKLITTVRYDHRDESITYGAVGVKYD